MTITAVLAILVTSTAARGEAPVSSAGDSSGRAAVPWAREEPFVKRTFHPFIGERWIGQAIAYGPHRDGQRPGGPAPTQAELRQDLRLMSRHWSLLRLYGAVGPADSILQIIRDDRLSMKVMLGVWIAPESPATEAANRGEIEAAVRLAATYPEIVVALSAGNETQVSWSDHRVPPEQLIACLRELRTRARLPVTTADDFAFWKSPGSRSVAGETDFIVTHLHPLWNGQQLDKALEWTRRTFDEVRTAHPDRAVVIGETGWATRRHNEGDQAKLMKGRLGEGEQKRFHDSFTAWARKERVVGFFFEAFDENWKGGPHPDEVEKHWGLFRADRSPKKAMTDGR